MVRCKPWTNWNTTHHKLSSLFLLQTRNAFCGTKHLPHSHVHNERTVPKIMAECIAHARNGHISKIWCHHRVPRPRFPTRCENFANLHKIMAVIGLFNICMGFRTCWPKMEVLGETLGKGQCNIDRKWTHFSFGGFLRLCQFLWKLIKKCNRESAHRRTHWPMQTDFIICPMLYAIAMGQIIMYRLQRCYRKDDAEAVYALTVINMSHILTASELSWNRNSETQYVELLLQGLMSHQTHYSSYWGRVNSPNCFIVVTAHYNKLSQSNKL